MFARFVSFLAWVATALFVLAGAMLTYEVLARRLFVAPTRWAAELSQLCLIWGSLLAMAWVLRERRHITVTAVLALAGPGARRGADLLALGAVLVFSLVVTWYGFDIFWDSFERGRTTGSLLNLPVWIPELSVPFGFALLAVQCVIEIVRTWRRGAPDLQQEHA